MDINKKVKITTPKQFSKMVELLEQNSSLAQGFTGGIHKIDTKQEWNKIAIKLNALGPPARTGEGWMKVWADFKFKLKKKLVHNKAESHATGGGSFNQHILSPTEEAASNLLQLSTITNPEGQAFGIQCSNVGSEVIEDDVGVHENVQNENEDEPPTLFSTKRMEKNKKQSNEKKQLLEDQLKVQTELYTDVKKSLADIESYQRKNHKLKEEKLKLYKSHLKKKEEKFNLYKSELKKKEEHRNALLKLRQDEIEIKRRRIELEEFRSGLNI